MPSYVVVGASRGIGLEYIRQLAARPGATVIAIARNPVGSTHLNTAIAGLRNVHVVAADAADYASLERAAKQVSGITGGKLDVLIHNAASVIMKGFDDYTNMNELDAEFMTTFKVNALGPVHSITAFIPLLRAASTRKIVIVGAAGADPKFVRAVELKDMSVYGMTKAAALIATTKFAVKLKDEGFIVVSISPGIVDISGTMSDSESGTAEKARIGEALGATAAMWKERHGITVEVLSPTASVAGQLKVIDRLKPSDNGLFLTLDGVECAPPN